MAEQGLSLEQHRYWRLDDPAVEIVYRAPGVQSPVEASYWKTFQEWFPTGWSDIEQLRQARAMSDVSLIEVTEPGGDDIPQ